MNEAEGSHEQYVYPPVDALSPGDGRDRVWAYENVTIPEERQPFNVAGAFASFGFLGAAMRRRWRFVLLLGVIGLVAGLGTFVVYPVSYKASVTVLVKNNPNEDPVSAMLTQLTLVESQSVASGAVRSLGLTQSVSSFQAAYTATVVTDQVLIITANAPTSSGAAERANAIAAQYLKFRAALLRSQQAQNVTSYAQQIPEAQQQIARLQSEVSQLQGQPAQQAQLTKVQNQLKTATDMLPTLEQTVTGLTASEKVTTSSMIDDSQVLSAATVLHHSTIKDLLEYVLSGLIGGWAIGAGIVVLRELISDRLRRRDDIAAALGAPVRLSVGRVAKRRFPLGGPSTIARKSGLRRIALYLRNSAAHPDQRLDTLAIVPVGNVREIAPAIVIMAERCAQEGVRILVADLVRGAPVAKLLGAGGVGVQMVKNESGPMIVFTPQDDDLAPSGPLPATGPAGPLAAAPAEDVVTTAKQVDMLLAIAELDPAVGGEYLGTWAEAAVAVFTAGRTRTARAYAVGEMLRLSGVRDISGLVVGADKTDESLGSALLDLDTAIPVRARSLEPVPNGSNGASGATP